jgi:excisionase family DNA binding protein
MSDAVLPDLLTPAAVADWLGLPVQRVERLGRQGTIPAITLPGGELIFARADLAAWLERLRAEGREVRRG